MKILAVDDDEIALGLLVEALAASGFHDVQSCGSAAQAYEVILRENAPFDCFLFDVQMPGMNGIDLCQEVRAMSRYKRTPVIMVTGLADKIHVDRAFAAGASDYLTKPFDPLEVGVRIGMSAELSNERKHLLESTDVIELLIKELDRVTRHELDEAIEIGNVKNVLSYPAFENYLFQMARGVFYLTSVFAVKVRNVEKLHAKLPPLEFKDFLTRSAAMIAAHLREHQAFLSYRGDGVFVGIMQRAGARVLKENDIEFKVETCTGDSSMISDLPAETGLVFGEPVVARIFSKPGSFRNLRIAIENAEGKAALDEVEVDPLDSEGHDRHEAFKIQKLHQQHLLREEYESFLRDSLESELSPEPLVHVKQNQ